MIKLIASDVDGTLVKDGSDEINPKIFQVISQLKEKGIMFAAASGRQYPSLMRLFEPVKDNVIFVAENGAYIVCRDTEMSVSPMNRELVVEIVNIMRNLPGCLFTASGKGATYIENPDEEFLDLLVNGYHNTIEIVDDVLAVNDTIIKLALYKKDGIYDVAKPLIEQWQHRVKVVIAGSMWLDFMDKDVDKGNALAKIQKLTGITKAETVCFGDNSNDIGMFYQAGNSYAVAGAKSDVKKEAKHIIGTYEEDSVIQVMESILKEK